MNSEEIDDLFLKEELNWGRMISGSKTAPKNHIAYFNCNVYMLGVGKIWYGDLNITKEGHKLKKIASKIGTLYILREYDGRFLTVELTDAQILQKSVWDTTKEIPKGE